MPSLLHRRGAGPLGVAMPRPFAEHLLGRCAARTATLRKAHAVLLQRGLFKVRRAPPAPMVRAFNPACWRRGALGRFPEEPAAAEVAEKLVAILFGNDVVDG